MNNHNIVLVYGSRDFIDSQYIYDVLDKEHSERKIDLIVNGDAAGADSIASNWAQKNGIPLCLFIPNWKFYGKAGGPIRNRDMARFMPIVRAHGFPLPDSIGTHDMTSILIEQGVPVVVHRYPDK